MAASSWPPHLGLFVRVAAPATARPPAQGGRHRERLIFYIQGNARMVQIDCTIRFATPADVPSLMQMVQALAEYEKLAHLVVADESRLAAALFGPGPAVEALIAREAGENGSAVGFALFFHTFSTFLGQRGLWLEDLFVYPQFRGRGVGRRLLHKLSGLGRGRGCGRFEWSVLDWNASAIGFYERMGATLLPDWRIVRVTGDALARFGQDPPP